MARIAQMLALALHIARALDEGVVPSFTAVAAQLGVSKQKISALMRLTFLAPDIQEEALSLTTIKGEAITEREVFEQVVCHLAWSEQRAAWRELCSVRNVAVHSPSAEFSHARRTEAR
ncbi:MAG: hypothetical protein K8M05_22175 [Deltaproteobacteria bacterium]|nr:hypothetical protein [Kofleriaceae bacterium]